MLNNNIKFYEVVANDSEVVAISLVESPAIDIDFVSLSKDNPQQVVCLTKDDKHLLVGCVLRPDYPIYRYMKGQEFYFQFSSEVIEKLAYKYMQNGHLKSFTTDHKDATEDITIVETWLKTSENDKSSDYGIDAPVGSWLIAAKVNNQEIWDKVKNGEYKGFSVESFVNLEEIILEKQDTIMTEEKFETIEVNESFWVKIATIIKEALKSPEVPELEAQVTSAQVVDEMKEEVAAEVIEEPEVIVDDMNEETAVEDTPTVVSDEPEVIADEVAEEVVEDNPTTEDAQADLQVIIDELNKKIDELNNQIAELQSENIQLSKQPSTKPVNVKGTVSENKFDRMLAVMNGTAFK